MGFELLANLKQAVEKFSELAKTDDQLGFSQNQHLSSLIMQVEYEPISIEKLTEIISVYKKYCSSWFEHIRNMSEVIRSFSIEKSNRINTELQNVESEIYDMIKNWETLSDDNQLKNSLILIADIKKFGHKLSSLFNDCMLSKEHIKKVLQEIVESL